MARAPSCGEMNLCKIVHGESSCSLRKAIHRLWNAFLMIGFIYQVTAITIIYLSYEINTAISIESSTGSPLASSIEFPDLTVCFDTESLIEPSVISSRSIDPFINPLANFTVEEMLKHTPDASFLIDTCVSRISPSDLAETLGPDVHLSGSPFNSLHRVQLYSKASCGRLYNVTKGIFEEYTCYTITLNNFGHLKFSLRPVVYSGKWSRLLYLFHLNESAFDTFSLIKPLVHPAKTIPYVTSAYSSWFVRKSYHETHGLPVGEGPLQPLYNSFKSAYKLYKIHRLPPPYESKCFNYTELAFYGQEDCIQRCLLEQVSRQLHLVPFTSFIRAPIDQGQLTLSQLESKNVSAILQRSEKKCFSRCQHPSCLSQISITSAESEFYPNLRIILFSPSSPEVIVSEEVAFRLLDYLIYMFSCFGSWFGLCWFSFNPVKLYDQVKSFHPKLHAKCLSASMDRERRCEKALENVKEEKNCYDSSRYSKFNSNYNSMLGFVSREIDTIKSLTQGSIRRAREDLHREICEIKADLKATKKSLGHVTKMALTSANTRGKGTIEKMTASFAEDSIESQLERRYVTTSAMRR